VESEKSAREQTSSLVGAIYAPQKLHIVGHIVVISEVGYTIWFTGLSGTGKTTSSRLLAGHLRKSGARVERLDGDEVRQHLSPGLGFSRTDRNENIRRIGFVCEILSRNNVVAIAAAISPYREPREELKTRIPRFVEIYMECPINILIERDVKGLYKKALSGMLADFSGISDPYEPPLNADVTIHAYRESPDQGVARILRKLKEMQLFASIG
jgi:adenylyl-sulfate kinase